MPANRPSSSPTARRLSSGVPHGFLKPRKERPTPVDQLSEHELRHQYLTNLQRLALLSDNSGRTAVLVQRQQDKIKHRIDELENAQGVEFIRVGVENTSISGIQNMDVDNLDSARQLKPIGAKQRALNQYSYRLKEGIMLPEEASRIEMERIEHDNLLQEQRRRRQEEREKRRSTQGLPPKAEKLSEEEIRLRLRAFMSHQATTDKKSDSESGDDDPATLFLDGIKKDRHTTTSSKNHHTTASDMESDSDSEDGNPANWFVDDQDEGIKHQQIVEPDNEDYSSVIRIDESKAYLGYNTFYEPKDED